MRRKTVKRKERSNRYYSYIFNPADISQRLDGNGIDQFAHIVGETGIVREVDVTRPVGILVVLESALGTLRQGLCDVLVAFPDGTRNDIAAICGQFLGYISSRGRGKWYGDLTEQMVFVPYLMSGIAFSTMYFSMFSRPHFGGLMPSLYGTFTLIVLTSVVKHFPFASKSGTANMLSISVELEEAADIAGASFWKRMSSIIVPLAKNGFISGFMLTFISIAKE